MRPASPSPSLPCYLATRRNGSLFLHLLSSSGYVGHAIDVKKLYKKEMIETMKYYNTLRLSC